MAKFLVCERMEGEGCDYTIGCGMTYDIIEADDIQDAEHQAIWPDGREEYSTVEGEMARSEILIVPWIHIHHVDVEHYVLTVADQRSKERQSETEAKERAEFERLSAKFK